MTAQEQRQALADLSTLAAKQVETLWRPLVGQPFDNVREVLETTLPVLGQDYGRAASSLASEYYSSSRSQAGVSGSFDPVIPGLPDMGRWRSLAAWGTQPLFRTNSGEIADLESQWGVKADLVLEPDWEGSLSRINGGLQRSIADQHRLTIMESSIADPKAEGWHRVGVGANCDFCRMLIGRGAVYREATASFRSHDRCNCVAEVAWKKGASFPVGGQPWKELSKQPETLEFDDSLALESRDSYYISTDEKEFFKRGIERDPGYRATVDKMLIKRQHAALRSDWQSSIDDSLRASLDTGYFSNDESFNLNAALRSGQDPTPEVQKMREAARAWETPEDLIVHRGMWDVGGLEGNLKDSIFKDDGFMSTTFDRDYAESWAMGRGSEVVVMDIVVPKGTKAAIGFNQDELMLPDGVELRVTQDTEQEIIGRKVRVLKCVVESA